MPTKISGQEYLHFRDLPKDAVTDQIEDFYFECCRFVDVICPQAPVFLKCMFMSCEFRKSFITGWDLSFWDSYVEAPSPVPSVPHGVTILGGFCAAWPLPLSSPTIAPISPFIVGVCRGCGLPNEYAECDQPGTYVCFTCKNHRGVK